MTTLFIILGILFLIGIVYLGNKWFKSEPKTDVGNVCGGYTQSNHGADTIEESVVERLSVIGDILFGRSGKLVKGETFYEGKLKKNSQLYFNLQIGMIGGAVFCGINDNVSKPRIQIAVMYNDKQVIGNPSNAQRQSLQPYTIHNGDSIWLSTDVLNEITLPEYFVLRIQYRIDNGNGYGKWENADAVNIHTI